MNIFVYTEILDENFFFYKEVCYKSLYAPTVCKHFAIYSQIKASDEYFASLNITRWYKPFSILLFLAKMDSKGLSIANLAVECIGSDSDFEDTVRVANDMW